LARFEREAKLLASLNHPNIATLYGLEEHEGRRFLVMELAEGETLAERLKKGPIPVDDALPVALQIAEGLEAAHEHGIIHRDLKPANVMVDGEGRVKVMDFGLAKMVEEVRRRASLIAGSPAYMAPEQAQGLEVDGRADLYALGVTLFELLTGHLPFEDGDPIHHHQNTPPPDPRERVASIPGALAELVARGVDLEKQVHDLVAGLGVQCSGRLVGKKETRLSRDGACDCYALLLPPGELRRSVAHPMAESNAL